MAIVTMMIGLPGSGKSTIAQKIAQLNNAVIISSDDVRAELYGDPSIQGVPQEVFNHVYAKARKILAKHQDIIIDATNISIKNREYCMQALYKLHRAFVAEVIATPLDICLQRNQDRDRQVPPHIIKQMYHNLELPSFKEGFSMIRYWDENGKVINTVQSYDWMD